MGNSHPSDSHSSSSSSSSSSPSRNHAVRPADCDAFLKHCSTGKLEEAKKLLERHSATEEEVRHFINTARDGNDMYATHHAAERGHVEILKNLLRFRPDLTLRTVRGNTALHIAARADQPECVKVLLRGQTEEAWKRARLLWINLRHPTPDCPFNVLPKDMVRYISRILMSDYQDNKTLLLRNNDDLTPLEQAVKSHSRSCISLLLTHTTASLIPETPVGSPLHVAAAAGCAEACEMLVKMGAYVDVLNLRRETPLFRAVCSYPQAAETVEMLLKLGADPRIRANTGKSCLEEAAARKYLDVVALLESALVEWEKKPEKKLPPVSNSKK